MTNVRGAPSKAQSTGPEPSVNMWKALNNFIVLALNDGKIQILPGASLLCVHEAHDKEKTHRYLNEVLPTL